MYEYKVLDIPIGECEKTLNQLAKAGWWLVTMMPDQINDLNVIITLEREIGES